MQTLAKDSREILLKVEGVSKKFCSSLNRSLWYGVNDIIRELSPFARSSHESDGGATVDLRVDEFWAVKDISFELRRGECLGLIGHNGAGKTTLLKMLNGLIKPDEGRIEICGKVGALIALGAGFNPILTGRENIYVNGAILGLRKEEIDAKLEEIIEFAEIGSFIDTPVQNYSSGMSVRLGFAVAAVLIQPDVLFLDEILAVGDIGFVIKCLNAVRRLAAKSAVVFVSHDMQFVSAFCTRVMCMDHGRCLIDARHPSDGIERYFGLIEMEQNTSGTGEASIRTLKLRLPNSDEPETLNRVAHGSSVCLELDFETAIGVQGATVHLSILDESMSPVFCMPVVDAIGKSQVFGPGRTAITVDIGKIELRAGRYSVLVSISDSSTGIVLLRTQGLIPFTVVASKAHWGTSFRPVSVIRAVQF